MRSFFHRSHRDGPGHLAVVDLPYGVEAAEAVARRARLASGMRLPFDQVWPEAGDGHPGRLALWVGYEPASQMKAPAWPLLSGGRVDVFKAFPFVTTPRMDAIDVGLMSRNWLIGGQPGSGKTFALRLLVLAAALDPRVELRGYELKGVGDFRCVEPVCTEYGNGFDDDTKARAAAMITWLYSECERRAKRIDHYAALGKAPENKVTPELASLKGSGLHPLVVFVDEVQELFQDPTWGSKAGEMAEKVIKLGRALGVILLLGTQIPDKDSLPPGITRNVNTRYCMSVADQVANDMILGTSAYRQGRHTGREERSAEQGNAAGTGACRDGGEQENAAARLFRALAPDRGSDRGSTRPNVGSSALGKGGGTAAPRRGLAVGTQRRRHQDQEESTNLGAPRGSRPSAYRSLGKATGDSRACTCKGPVDGRQPGVLRSLWQALDRAERPANAGRRPPDRGPTGRVDTSGTAAQLRLPHVGQRRIYRADLAPGRSHDHGDYRGRLPPRATAGPHRRSRDHRQGVRPEPDLETRSGRRPFRRSA